MRAVVVARYKSNKWSLFVAFSSERVQQLLDKLLAKKGIRSVTVEEF